MNLKSGFLRVGVILAFAIAICWSSQAAQPSSTDSGRLVVGRSPAIGTKVFVRLSIDGEVHNIKPGGRYDEPIAAGQHVLRVDTPSNQTHPTSMSLTVEPGHTYAFTATRNSSDEGVSLQRSRILLLPRQAGRNPSSGFAAPFRWIYRSKPAQIWE